MTEVELDTEGRLQHFLAVPSQADSGVPPVETPDWSVAFAKAGLNLARFEPSTPAWIPPVYADARAAWEGGYPGREDLKIRVEAAAEHGRLVYFDVLYPWDRPVRSEAPAAARSFTSRLVPLALLGVLAAALLLAVRNLRLGRGDRRGAFRIGNFLFVVMLASGFVGADLPDNGNAFLVVVLVALSEALLFGVLAWVGYVALEPFVRRRWPRVLISWSRLLAGRLRDPLVARDVLAGTSVGLALTLILVAVEYWTPGGSPPPVWPLDGFRFAITWLLNQSASSVLLGIGIVFALLALTSIVRRWWIAVALVLAFFAASAASAGPNPVVSALFEVFGVGSILAILWRFGLLAVIVTVFTTNVCGQAPLTFDASQWYAPSSYLVIAIVIGLAAFGAWKAADLRSLLAGLSE
jgi:hypothetical protein